QGFFIGRRVDSLIFQNNITQRIVHAEHFKSELGSYFRELDELLWLDEYQFILRPIPYDRFSNFLGSASQRAPNFNPLLLRRS
ncbi:MAG: hypothetical protein K2Z81_06365, partial [Cyanobacteria bacterium]|nr:hypothetical protein [Cyanobacteriota bacterium]